MEKLSTQGPDYTQHTSCHNSKTGLSKMGTNRPCSLTLPKTIKMTLVRPSRRNLKMTVRANCAVSTSSPLLLLIKSLAPLATSYGQGGVGLRTDFCPHPPTPAQLPASEVKQMFLSTNLAGLLAVEHPVTRPHTPFSNRLRKADCSPKSGWALPN